MSEQSTLQSIVRTLPNFSSYNSCQYSDWNFNIMQFRPFSSFPSLSLPQKSSLSQVLTTDIITCYFKLYTCPSSFKYIKSKYQQLYKDFYPLFINLQVQLIHQRIHDCVYLLRGVDNYFSLQLLIEKEERKVLGVEYILKLLRFFKSIMKVNKGIGLEIELNVRTILEKDGRFKLADYRLLFHPCNLRKSKQRWEQRLLKQMQYVIFDVLSLKNRFEKRERFQENSRELVKQLREKRHEGTRQFVEIIETFFRQGVILSDQIDRFKRFGPTINSTELFASTDLTVSDISIPLLQGEETMQQSLSDVSFVKKVQINKKRLWRVMLLILILILIAAGSLTYFFLTRQIECGKFHYQENRTCLSCPDGCYSCVNGGNYSCTYCIQSHWLILKNQSEKTGKCSVECVGFKDQGTMHCFPLEKEKNRTM